MSLIAERIPVVDSDSHVTEPPDLWTSRLPEEWGDLIPHTFYDERRAETRWRVGSKRLTGVAMFAMAGWREFPPSNPKSLEDADPAAWHPGERLKRLDEYGLYAQVLYPNLLGFYNETFLEEIRDGRKLYACVAAYNDFLSDFASEDRNRFIPVMALPFWDLDLSLQEIKRAHAKGHKGILFSNAPEKIGLPALRDSHWNPLWELAEELHLSINFHVGFMGATSGEVRTILRANERFDAAKHSSLAIISNAAAIAEVTMSGLCHRYPGINFVSVESGFGWLPFFLELLDWQWLNSGCRHDLPHMELPSYYFRRQVYGSFWFESEVMRRLLDLLPDNIMFETDFPHPTSLSPGPASYAANPKHVIEENLAGLPEELIRKVLYQNASKVYNLDLVADGTNWPRGGAGSFP